MKAETTFKDRKAAGKALAQRLAGMNLADPVVLALPRGGVPVGAEIAETLQAPLDLVLVRKIGVPYQPELAAAAVVDGGDAEIVVNDEVMRLAGITDEYIQAEAKTELLEIERRRHIYLEGRPRVPIENRTLILVDDGIATGASIRAAIAALRRKHPKKLIVAVPVAPLDTVAKLGSSVDEVICLEIPDPFYAIGMHYDDFHQVPDDEVIELMNEAARDEAHVGSQNPP